MLPSIKDYTIREMIAEGRHTMIFRAQRKSDQHFVIIKLLKTESIIPKNVEQLTHEYDMLTKLHSPHVVKAFELLPIQNSLLLVMEDPEAQTLSVLIEEDDLDLLSSLEIAIRISDAVGDIHHQHIIHKDLKPHNILVNKDKTEIKVIDFGIATQLSREVLQTLNPEQVEGSIAYVSPEQTGRMNRPLDYRTDIYSLGVTLYHLFTKKLPFDAESSLELIHLHIAQQPIPPMEVNPAIPKVLSDIILKCMSKEAEHRYHSAYGLKYDLEKCRSFLLETSEIPEFKIGEKDVFDHFHIPEKLFGRHKELNFINQCYNEVWGGETVLLTISGYAGVGKSSLVLEAQKNIASKNGRFINAKFDQFKRNIPYYGLIQAFQGLIHQLLGEPDETLQEWKEKILDAVGSNGQVIADVIPEIKLVIGDPPPVDKLPPQDNANRFNYVMTNFIKAFLHPDKPLVIFIDDFQWVDEPSLKLLELFFIDKSIKNLLFIIAYRDNEVAPFHPLMITLREIAAQGGKVINLAVPPLNEQTVQEIIQDAFYGPPKQTEQLAKLLFRKTQGNPFFTLQLLKLLYEQELFYFDKVRGCWMAKLDAITMAQVSDNVADLMIAKLKSLPSDVLKMLTVGSAMESRFDLELLSKVSEIPQDKVTNLLAVASQEDMIVQERDTRGGMKTRDELLNAITYRFMHDRIQQAAYGLLSDAERKKLHSAIGTALLESTPPEKLQEKCIDIVNHLNQGDIRILSIQEKEQLVKLNSMAGLKAKDSIAYLPAIQYLTKGIELLPEKSWDTNYETAMELHENLALCLSISGGAKQAEAHFDLCLEKARSNIERTRIYRDLIVLSSQLQDYSKCFAIGTKALHLLGVDYNLHPSKLSLIIDLLKLKIKTRFHKISDLENKPVLSDQKYPLIIEILQALTYPAFVTGNKILFLKNALTIIDLSLSHGISRPTSVGLATYAMVLGSEMLKDYETSSLYGKVALNIAQRFPRTLESGGTTYMYYAFIHRWKNSLRTSSLPLRHNFRVLLETGGGPITAANGVYINLISLVTGEKLDTVLESTIEMLQEIKKFSSSSEEFSSMVHREVCASLKGLTQDPTDPRPAELTDDLINASSTNQNLLYLLRYDVWHLVLLYLFGRYEEALAIGRKVLTKTDNYPNWIEWHIFYFFHCLTLAATLQTPKTKPENWKLLQSEYKKLQRWAKASPINYSHYEKIVKAEMARIQNEENAVTLYEDAIASAKKSECTQDIAIAYELLGKYYKEKDLHEMTSIFLHKALQYYTQWGADAKCLDFKNTYAEFLTLETLSLSPFTLKDMSFLTTTAHTKTTVSSTTASQTGSTRKTESRSADTDFDVNALIDASQALSKEIVLEKLMESLMHVVIVNAGADKAFLILFENKKAHVYSQIFLTQKYSPLLTPIPVEQKSDELSTGVIKYVTRTNTELLLNNATEEGNFRYDPYVLNKKPKSILCIPLIQKGVLTGVLYLENNASKGAFTPKRLRLLSLLSSQMAISIENAQFYAKLESKVQERTKELQQRNQELQQALQTIKNVQQQMIQQEKLASLGLLTSGIAHELKNPLNFVINFAQIAREHVKELIEELKEKGSLAKEKLETFADIQQTLDKVDVHGKRADGIIKGMLMHAHQGSGQAEQIDLNALVDQALNLTYQSYRKKDAQFNLTFNKNYDEELRHVLGYPGDLIRVFINIFDNACYAILEKTKNSPPGFSPQFNIKTEHVGETAVITIRDNGLGIPQKVIDKVFLPFFTTKPTGSGTGLGLSIVYDIITKQHGGSIQVKSELGEFTEFNLTLPLIPEETSL